MAENNICAVCKSNAEIQVKGGELSAFYVCPVCGRYELYALDELETKAGNQLAPYLLYHSFGENGVIEYRYNTPLDKETCDKYNEEFNSGHNTHGRPVHMDVDMISAWYPKSFAERVDFILLYINSRISHIGQFVTLGMQEVFSMLFIDRKEYIPNAIPQNNGSWNWREDTECEDEAKYMLDYLEKIYTSNAEKV